MRLLGEILSDFAIGIRSGHFVTEQFQNHAIAVYHRSITLLDRTSLDGKDCRVSSNGRERGTGKPAQHAAVHANFTRSRDHVGELAAERFAENGIVQDAALLARRYWAKHRVGRRLHQRRGRVAEGRAQWDEI